MDNITSKVRFSYWADIIKQCGARPEGISIKKWLTEQGIKRDRYYYWQKRLRLMAYDQMAGGSQLPTASFREEVAFAEVPVPDTLTTTTMSQPGPSTFKPDAIIRKSGMILEISNTASPALVNRLLGVVKHA